MKNKNKWGDRYVAKMQGGVDPFLNNDLKKIWNLTLNIFWNGCAPPPQKKINYKKKEEKKYYFYMIEGCFFFLFLSKYFLDIQILPLHF